MRRWLAEWWRRRRVNWAHERALATYCQTDGRRHIWDYDYGGRGLPGWPHYVTPFGDRQICIRNCGARRYVDQPGR